MKLAILGLAGGIFGGLLLSMAGRGNPADIGPGLVVALAVAGFMAGGVWLSGKLAAVMARQRYLHSRRRTWTRSQ